MAPGRGPNFPAALAIAPNAPRPGTALGAELRAATGTEAWRHDSAADIAAYGIAGRIWYVHLPLNACRESAFLLMQYIAPSTPLIFDPPCTIVDAAPRTVLELGAGVGTAGLALAHALHCAGPGHMVLLTDLPDVVPLLQRNARAAQVQGMDVRVCALPWGCAEAAASAQAAAGRPLTHLLCSDLVYFPELLAPLLRTLIHLTSTAPAPEVVVGYKIRSLTKEQPFWAAFGAWFDFQVVHCAPAAQPHAWAPLGAHAAHLAHAPHGTLPDDYFVFVAHRKPHTRSHTAPKHDAALLEGRRVVRAPEVYDTDMGGVETFEWILLNRSA